MSETLTSSNSLTTKEDVIRAAVSVVIATRMTSPELNEIARALLSHAEIDSDLKKQLFNSMVGVWATSKVQWNPDLSGIDLSGISGLDLGITPITDQGGLAADVDEKSLESGQNAGIISTELQKKILDLVEISGLDGEALFRVRVVLESLSNNNVDLEFLKSLNAGALTTAVQDKIKATLK